MKTMDDYDETNDALDGMAESMWPEQEEIEMPEINVPPREDLPKFINQGGLRKVLKVGDKFRIASPSREGKFGQIFTIELPNGEMRSLTFKSEEDGTTSQKLAVFVGAWGNNTDKWVDRFMVYTGDYVNPQYPNKPSMSFGAEKEDA